MAYYTAFQWNAFQWNAFQIARQAGTTGLPGKEPYIYVTPHQKHREEEQKEKIKKSKTELEKLESVLKETERKKALAAESKRLAEQRNTLNRAIELEALEQEYLNEINRLLMVRAEMMRRIRSEEEFLILLIVARKRLRINWQVKTLA